MGWLFRDQPLRHETPVDYFKRQFTCDGSRFKSTVLDAAAVRGTVYAAIRNQEHETGADYVFCAVILFKNNRIDGFGYKDMCESMGPCEVDCPDRIMRLLSPVESIPNPSYTADWRERVAAAKEKRKATRRMASEMKPGAIIKLAHQASFEKTGIVASQFRLAYFRKRTPIFEPLNAPGMFCRLRRETLAGASIVTQEVSPTLL